ncbi:MAG: RagB/SusD family nutrient uptake outer membrane protein, partial [Terrimonas sp.]|nr:RagB/SusD family nutrient uptake outer membrane protein [Terrimonas sp.]
GTVEGFTGLATDEVYLINAECLVRKKQIDLALEQLNKLMENRFIAGTFEPLETGNADLLLEKILIERRKELCFRGIRWQDVRRLNKEGAEIVLRRELNGVEYTLEANSIKYVLPIPPAEIQYSGILQNER